MILPEDEEERQNREDKILQSNDECTESNREEAKATTTLECHDNKKYCNNRQCTNNVYNLYLAIVVQVVFCVFLVCWIIVLGEYWSLHTGLDGTRYYLDDETYNDDSEYWSFLRYEYRNWFNKRIHKNRKIRIQENKNIG